MLTRIIFIGSLILLLACSKRQEQVGTNFLVKENGDTLSFFFYPIYKDYEFKSTPNYDSAILDSTARSQLSGRYIFGVIEKNRYLTRFLTFKGDSGSNFHDFWEPEDFFLHTEFNIENYRVEIVDDWIDSTNSPLTMHSTMAAIDLNTQDTILFQELNYVQKQSYLVYNLIVYESLDQREDMKLLIDASIDAIYKSVQQKRPRN